MSRPRQVQTRSTVVQRPSEGRLEGLLLRWQEGWRRLLRTPWVWVTFFVLTLTWLLLPRDPRDAFADAEVNPGTIATRDYVAPVDLPVEDEETTAAKRSKAREDVLPVYDFDSRAAQVAEGRIARLFEAGRRSAQGPDRRSALQETSQLKLSPEMLEVLRAQGFSSDLEDRLRSVLGDTLRQGVVSDRDLLLENRDRGVTLVDLATSAEREQLDLYEYLDYPEAVRAAYSSEVRSWPGLGGRQRRVVTDFLLENTSPNLSFNGAQTQARQEQAAANADAVFVQIRKGEVIVRRGDKVSPAAARAIAALGRGDGRGYVLPLLATVLLLLLAVVVVWRGVKEEKVADHSREQLFSEGLLLLTLSCLGVQLGLVMAEALGDAVETATLGSARSYAYAVPFAALALVARLLFSRQSALVLSLLLALVVGRLVPEAPLDLVTYCLGGSLAAIFALDWFQFKQRLVLARAGGVVGLANAVLALTLACLAPSGIPPAQEVGFQVLCGGIGGLLVAAVASFSVPILESALGVTTDIKLVELANTNLPLLRRLAFEAPGTFQHSLMVANLAKEGCEAVGADPIQAYAVGLYHDVGKVYRPDYFIENQHPGANRHDKLQPSMSALILINHVKDGLELARRYRLPQLLHDAIAQHHGTRLINFFYNRALEKVGGDEVREADYRYPGPKPQSRVMGILMLADGVEAASRTLREPSPQRIRELVRQIVDDCLDDGQLDETDLTLGDIQKVSEAFHRVLSNIYHRRIDYPGFDFNRESPARRQGGDPDPGSPAGADGPDTISSRAETPGPTSDVESNAESDSESNAESNVKSIRAS